MWLVYTWQFIFLWRVYSRFRYIYIHITHTTHDAGIFIPICYIMLMFIMQVEANIFIYIYNPMDAMGRNGAFPTENLWIPRLGSHCQAHSSSTPIWWIPMRRGRADWNPVVRLASLFWGIPVGRETEDTWHVFRFFSYHVRNTETLVDGPT